METREEYSGVDVWLVALGCQVLGGGGVQKKISTPPAAEHIDWRPTVSTMTERLSEWGQTNTREQTECRVNTHIHTQN